MMIRCFEYNYLKVVIVDIKLLFKGDEETIDHCWGVLECVLELNMVDNGFDQGSGQTKYYKIVICCFTGKHT
jgi:hypothetical protein